MSRSARLLVALAVASPLLVLAACSSGSSGESSTYCTSKDRFRTLDLNVAGSDLATTKRNFADATARVTEAARTAPKDIKPDLTVLRDVVRRMNALIQQAQTDADLVTANQALAQQAQTLQATAVRLMDYDRKTCGVDSSASAS